LGLFALDVNAEPSAPAAGDYGRAPNVPQGRRGARSRRHRPALEQKWTQVEERVALGYDRIAHQGEIVLEKDDEGVDSSIALAILGQLKILQCIHIAERDRLLAETGHGNNPPSGARSKAEPAPP
jgi:hypothetical protein